jgi:glucose-1-phosphate thymidylyltransferase
MEEKERVKGKYGVLEINSDLKIINSKEKPETPKSTLISTACYIFTKADLAMIKKYLAVRKTPDVIGFCGFAQIYRRENQ